jgi:hypothetical protein
MSLNRPAAQRPGGREIESAENVCVCVRVRACVWGCQQQTHTCVCVYSSNVQCEISERKGGGGVCLYI